MLEYNRGNFTITANQYWYVFDLLPQIGICYHNKIPWDKKLREIEVCPSWFFWWIAIVFKWHKK